MDKKGDTFIDDDGWYGIYAADTTPDDFLDDYQYILAMNYIEGVLGLKWKVDFNYKSMIDVFYFHNESDLVAFKLWFL